MPKYNQITLSNAKETQQSGSAQVDQAGKASNLVAEVLLKIIELATYTAEDEREFDSETLDPLTLRHPFGATLRRCSAVNRWWRTVIYDIRPRDIKCYTIQQVRDGLESLIASNIRSIGTFFWQSPQSHCYSNYEKPSDKTDDNSTIATRTKLFERFLQHVDGSIKVLLLKDLELKSTLDVTNYGGWQRVTSFYYKNGSLPNCGLLLTSLLRQLSNLESLHFVCIKEHYEHDLPPRPTYSLKKFSFWYVDDPDFLAWTGGNSRGTLEELCWDTENDPYDTTLASTRAKADLRDVFPGHNLLSLRRILLRGRYVSFLDHCDPATLKWLSISFVTWDFWDPLPEETYAMIIRCLSRCTSLERLWMDEERRMIHKVAEAIAMGGWPSLVFLHLRNCRDTSGEPVEEMKNACRDRNIVFIRD